MIRFVFSTVILLGISMLVGCGQEATSTKGKTAEAKGNANETAHSGWWCDEHGIKESECSMCSSKVAKSLVIELLREIGIAHPRFRLKA